MSTVPSPRTNEYRQLSTQTLAWLADRSPASTPVRAVWTMLTELERAGDHPGILGALYSILLDHQPVSRRGRCRGCRRFSWRRVWRRRPFPCRVWINTHFELHGFFSGNHARTPASHGFRGQSG
jgi:hypothetical protein